MVLARVSLTKFQLACQLGFALPEGLTGAGGSTSNVTHSTYMASFSTGFWQEGLSSLPRVPLSVFEYP